MNLEKLLATYPELLTHMENDGYSEDYIKNVEWEIKWLQRTHSNYHFTSYEEMFRTRVATGRKPQCSVNRESHLRVMYALLQRFEEDDVFPDRRKGRPLLPRSSYYKLLPEFREVVDLYKSYAEKSGLKESTIKKRIYKSSCFLLQYNLVGTLGSQPGVSSVSCQSYNKRSNWLATPFLGYKVRATDCQPSSCCGIRFKQVEP